jgi:hypothetical protein
MTDKDKIPLPKRSASWWNPFSWFPVIRRDQPVPDFRPPPAVPPQQQSGWVPEPWWPHQQQPPMVQRFPGLYTQQANDLPEPPTTPVVSDSSAPLSTVSKIMVSGRAEMTLTPGVEDIDVGFQEALRCAAELASLIDQLRKASSGRQIGPGHNQGPSLEDLDDVEELIALLRDQGPRVKTAVDAKALIEQTEKVKRLPERIWNLLKAAGLMVAVVGVHKVTEDLTAPLWNNVAHRIADLCHIIEVWVTLLPPM